MGLDKSTHDNYEHVKEIFGTPGQSVLVMECSGHGLCRAVLAVDRGTRTVWIMSPCILARDFCCESHPACCCERP
jgi:hypothetical protein